MITADGWLDWARRVPGPPEKTYDVPNTGIGYVPHSAVGFYPGWESRLFGPDRASVHGWIAYDGSVTQHYPLTASCWASGSRYPNCNFIAFENEGGPPGNESEPLREAQIEANLRIIRELAAWRGWTGFRRPVDAADVSANLYEHRECVRWQSDPTACPSGRIPWDMFLERLAAAPPIPPTPAVLSVVVRLADGTDVSLDIDEYAKGVVPNEMATGWPAEALKAQAVVAKSYALAKGAPVLTTTQDQVYLPEKRAADTDAAVDAVRGIYATFQGQIVMPFFFAHCNGRTRSPSEAGWAASADRPFLQSVQCVCGRPEYFGHGIGMCQEGARVMAERGASFDQILRHYYTGIELLGFAGAVVQPAVELQDYLTQPGDTLLTIAARFGIEWGAIFTLNRGLLADPNVVPEGLLLKLPLPVAEEHVVQTGDTLFSLARRWNTTVAAIAALNGIADPGQIRIGQRLRRPL